MRLPSSSLNTHKTILHHSLKKKRSRINFILPKFFAALDRYKLSVRLSYYIIQATSEVLGHNVNSLKIYKSSIHRCRDALRIEHTTKIITIFRSFPSNYEYITALGMKKY